jgi:tetratricopeptide (TPR) repeat protein
MESGTGNARRRAAACLLLGGALLAVSSCAWRESVRLEAATLPSAPPAREDPGVTVAVPEARVLEAEAEALIAAGDLFGAIDLLERAIALRENVPNHDRLEVAETLERLADLLEAIDRPSRSSSLTERALEIRTASDAVPDDKARMLAGLAWVQQQQDRAEEAEQLHRRALARLDQMGPQEASLEASALPHRALRARIHARLGRLQHSLERDEEALESFEYAAGLLDAARPEEQLLGAGAARGIAEILVARDQYDAAAVRLAHALNVYDRLLPSGETLVGDTSARLALVSLLRGDTDNALVLFDRAIAIAEAEPNADDSAIARMRHHRMRGELAHANRQLAQDLVEPACLAYTGIVARLDAADAPDPGNLALGVAGLAECAWRRGDPDEAERHYARAIGALDASDPPDPALQGSLLAGLASLRAAAGRHENAVVAYERALASYDAAPDAPPATVAHALYHAGNSYLALFRRPEALVRYVRALSLREQALPEGHPDLARSLDSVGAMLLERGDLDGARPLLERAVAIHEGGVTSEIELGASLSYLGRVQAKQGDSDAARETLARAVALLEPALGKLDPLTLATRAGLENVRATVPADRAP